MKYNNADVRQKFAKTDVQAGKAARQDFRGKDGQKVLDPDRDRPGAGDRDRPGAGDRDRPGAGDRDRPAAGRSRPARRRGRSRPRRPRKARARAAASARSGGGPEGGQQPSPKPSQQPSRPQRDTAFSHVQSGQAARPHADRGRQSIGGGGGRAAAWPLGAAEAAAAAVAAARGGGGRRSDVALKHDIVLLGHLDNGLGFYRFSYNGSDKAYVGVMAQEVQTVVPEAVVRGRDGYLRVFYDKLGLEFQSYDRWIASGARLPSRRSGTEWRDARGDREATEHHLLMRPRMS